MTKEKYERKITEEEILKLKMEEYIHEKRYNQDILT